MAAFWIRKSTPGKTEGARESEANSSNAKKRKEEKKAQATKRLDSLRIPHQLRIVIKSLGTRSEYAFLTRDLSSSGAFVVCSNIGSYPFQQTSTILDCMVDLLDIASGDVTKLRFLAKIARIVDGAVSGNLQSSGFGIRIVQISVDQRHILESFIAAHGTPEPVAGSGDAQVDDVMGDEAEDSDEDVELGVDGEGLTVPKAM